LGAGARADNSLSAGTKCDVDSANCDQSPREDRAELLSHGKTGIQVRHYERSDYILPKFAALQALEQWVLTEPSPAKVVPITKGKRKAAA